MDVYHSVCFNVGLIFSQKQYYYFLEDKLLLVIKHGFIGSGENGNFNDFQQYTLLKNIKAEGGINEAT